MIEWIALTVVLSVVVFIAIRAADRIERGIDRYRHPGEYPWQRDYRRWRQTLDAKHMDEKGKWR